MKKKIIEFLKSTSNLKESSKSLLALGSKLDLNLEVVIVVEPLAVVETTAITPTLPVEETDIYFRLLEETEKEVQQVISSFGDISSDIEISFKIEQRRLDDLIEKKSEEEDTYMIIIPEDSFREDISVLTFFDKFSQIAHCPILRLPQNYNPEYFCKILYATDFLEEDKVKLKKLIEIARAFDASITMLHVNAEKTNEDVRNAVNYFAEILDEPDYATIDIKIIDYDDIPQGINDYAKVNGYDLVAVLREKKGFLKNLFTKSQAIEITKKSSQPILMFYE